MIVRRSAVALEDLFLAYNQLGRSFGLRLFRTLHPAWFDCVDGACSDACAVGEVARLGRRGSAHAISPPTTIRSSESTLSNRDHFRCQKGPLKQGFLIELPVRFMTFEVGTKRGRH